MFKKTLPVAASRLQVKVASKEVNLMAPAALQGVKGNVGVDLIREASATHGLSAFGLSATGLSAFGLSAIGLSAVCIFWPECHRPECLLFPLKRLVRRSWLMLKHPSSPFL